MSIIEDIKGLVGEFRSGLAELAQQDQARIAEAQELRGTVARQAATLDEQRSIIAKLTAANAASKTHVDKLTDEAATLRAQLDQAALVIGIKERGVHPSSLTDVLTVAEDDRREALAHVRTLLGILDAIGGYMSSDYQAAIRAAREAVQHG